MVNTLKKYFLAFCTFSSENALQFSSIIHFLGCYFHGVLFTKFFVYTRHDSVTCIAGALSHSVGCLIKSSSFICSINNDFMKSHLLVVGLESSYLSPYSQMLSPLLLKVSSFRSNIKIFDTLGIDLYPGWERSCFKFLSVQIPVFPTALVNDAVDSLIFWHVS